MASHHSMRTLQKKRTTNFREDETKLLIQLWGSPQIQNKLYLTHRKAPVMRILAANMQRHGFYRTPDEIKTRIRNLKCLYHRIKRTVQSGAGLGTVDPDWPHYRAMDSILSKESIKKENLYKDNVLEGPRCEDIKQEIEDIEINDDMESYTTTSNHESEYGSEETTNLPSLTPAPHKNEKNTSKKSNKEYPTIMPSLTNFAIPLQTQQVTSPHSAANNNNRPNGVPSLPFPLFIVQQKPQVTNGETNSSKTNLATMQSLQQLQAQPQNCGSTGEINVLLKDLVDIQRENLSVEKRRLELERERLDYHKNVGSQLLTLIPVFGSLLQNLILTNEATSSESSPQKNSKRKKSVNDEILRESKILRTVLEKNIKRYMLEEDYQEESDQDESTLAINEKESPKKKKKNEC
ncbi:uncharacterized protein LOC123316780 [Coccinella septempunctata]|uniref:uncharacterized protein LOC123316780 n=1 Tax=Coccinella septempunctata TaxID=41139 RepID=UPI001D07D18D|nr:uncharacterized protein LOC123316780 [Coccinella septempunctata]XP_044758936.1 uncharacterized protein LOC123316780 [Coccinella septempunctata]